MKPWQWSQDMQSEEARLASSAYVNRKLAAKEPLDAHDPEFLYCLDKVDIISRYGMLVDQYDRYKRETSEFHESEISRLKATVEKAGKWWDHCVKLRRQKRKTANLSDMEAS